MTTELFITPEETPAEIEAANALRNWDAVRSNRMRGEATKEEEITAGVWRDKANEALRLEKEARGAS